MQDSNPISKLVRWKDAIMASMSSATGTQTAVGRLQKKVLYIHVAKAGGSSFNRVLHAHFKGEAHCEQYIDTVPDANGVRRRRLCNLEVLNDLEYISGHLPYPLLCDSEISLDDYLVVTILRHPFAQTLSHLNWVIKISEDEQADLFRHVAPNVQLMSKKLRGIEEWTPATLFQWLETYSGWFKDNQSRYFVRSDELSADAVIDVLNGLSLVGIVERIDNFIEQFWRVAGVEQAGNSLSLPHENKNHNYVVPLSLLDEPAVIDYLSEYNKVDVEVYGYIDKIVAP